MPDKRLKRNKDIEDLPKSLVVQETETAEITKEAEIPHTSQLSKREEAITQTMIKRPLLSYKYRQVMGVQLPFLPQTYEDLEHLSKIDPVVRMCTNAVRNEIFRNGIKIKPKFWGCCDTCNEEFESKPLILKDTREDEFHRNGAECPVCELVGKKNGTIRPPDRTQKNFLKKYIKEVNSNGQALIEVCKQVEDDLNKYDDGYVVILKDYWYDKPNDRIYRKSKVREILRGNPALMRIDTDERGNIGAVHWTCLVHRSFVTVDPLGDKCSECGETRLYPVYYVATRNGGREIEQAYIKGEVIHKNKYEIDLLYGYPPILTLWYHIMANVNMTRFISDYYDYRRLPAGALAIPAHSFDSVKAMWEDWQQELLRDPHYIPLFQIPLDTKAEPKFIPFINTMKEMDYIQTRDEFRQRISSFYGISLIWQGDASVGGGLNNEGLQLTVQNRTVESGQGVWNSAEEYNGIFYGIEKSLGITDYYLFLPPTEEEDRVAPLQQKLLKLQIAETAGRIGLDAVLPEEGLNEETDFTITGEVQMGGMGGLGGFGGFGSGGQDEGDSSAQEDQAGDDSGTGELQKCIEEKIPKIESEHPDWSPQKVTSMAKFECSGSGGSQERDTEEEEEEKPEVDDEADSKREQGKPSKPRKAKGLYFDANMYLLAKSTERSNEGELFVLKVSDPLDSLSLDLTRQIVLYYKNAITTTMNDFRNRRPNSISTQELLKAIAKLTNTAVPIMTGFASDFFYSTFILGKLTVLFEQDAQIKVPKININALIDSGASDDPDAKEAFKLAQPFLTAFEDMTLDISNKLRQEIIQTFEVENRKSIPILVQELQNVVDTEKYRLDRIARSESQRFALAGRELGYKRIMEEEGAEYRFIWLIRDDDRTSDQCREIEKRVPQGGIPLDELYQVVLQVQRDMMGASWRADSWLVHPNCRSVYVRVQ